MKSFANILEQLWHRTARRMVAWRGLAMLVDDLVNHPVFLGLFGIHDEVAFYILFDARDVLSAMLGKKFVDGRAHAQNFFGVQDRYPWLDRRGRTSTVDESGCGRWAKRSAFSVLRRLAAQRRWTRLDRRK